MSTLHKLIYREISVFKESLAGNKRILCFDYGQSRIGCAISDYSRNIALAHKLYDKKNKLTQQALKQTLLDNEIGGFVIGYPIQMDGTKGKSCQIVDEFVEKFLSQYQLPIFLQDERLSSKAVEKGMQQMQINRKDRSNNLDVASAIYILQIVLDKINSELI